MKVITDLGIDFNPEEVAWGLTRYGVWDDTGVIDSDNDLEALAKRHGLDPKNAKRIKKHPRYK